MKKAVTMLLLSFAIAVNSFAISEKNYQSVWETDVFPFFLNNAVTGYFQSNHDGIYLYYALMENQSAARNNEIIVIAPGRREPFFRYAEMAYDLYKEGYSIAFIDHRGQGGSERMLTDTEKGYVKDFQYYVDDLEWFMDSIVSRLNMDKTYLLAHSMGGVASAMLMAERTDLFDKAVLSSPMFKPITGSYNATIALIYAGVLKLLGQGDEYAPGESGYTRDSFEGNKATSSEARWEKRAYIFDYYPEFQVGGVTVNWIYTTLTRTNQFVADYDKVQTPVLLFSAGKDEMVSLDRQHTFCEQAASCELVEYPSSKHEIFTESDPVRGDALTRIIEFLKN